MNVHAEEAAAAHEEIATLNEEMQATNEELNTTNDELQRRGSDLETLAKGYDERFSQLNEQRDLLDAVIGREISPIAIVRGEDGLVYASASIAEWITTQPGGWWKTPDPIIVAGRKYALASSEIVHDAKPYRMISFRPA